MYQININGQIIRDDGAFIPADPGNRDYADFLDWEAAGNTPQGPALVDVSAAKTEQLGDAYKSAITQSVTYMGTKFQADPASQDTLCKVLVAVTPAGSVPEGFYWVDNDNNQVPMNLKQLQGLAGAMMAQGWTAFRKLQDLKTSARAATTNAAIDALTW